MYHESAFMDTEEFSPDFINKNFRESKEEPVVDVSAQFAALERRANEEMRAHMMPQPHQFSVDGMTYEWMDGKYFKKINEI